MMIASHDDFETEVDEALEACLDLLSVRNFEHIVKQMLMQEKNIWLRISMLNLEGRDSQVFKEVNFLWTDCPHEYDQSFVFIIFINPETAETRTAVYNKSLLF